jgi:hypothetical protein
MVIVTNEVAVTDTIEEADNADSFLAGMRHAMRIALDRPSGITPENAQMQAYNRIILKREREEKSNAPNGR